MDLADIFENVQVGHFRPFLANPRGEGPSQRMSGAKNHPITEANEIVTPTPGGWGRHTSSNDVVLAGTGTGADLNPSRSRKIDSESKNQPKTG